MTSPSSFNVSGLLGGNTIDTTTLVSQLVQAASIPQSQLKTQLSTQQQVLGAYQTINTRVTAVQTAANTVLDPATWSSTSAASSSTAVVATSDATALPGTTTFTVSSLARAQVSTTVVGAGGIVVSDPSSPMILTAADGTVSQIPLTGGSAADVASSINAAGKGIHATVLNTVGGQVLQITSTTTGAAAGFSLSGFDNPFNTIVTAKDAQIDVGDPLAGGYSITSATNTFTDAIPGVTFSVGAEVSNVSITVSSDRSAVSDKVKALVDALVSASNGITVNTGKGGTLAGQYSTRNIALAFMSAVSSSSIPLKQYGIDIDKNGVVSFDADAFKTALAADPTATKNAISGFATSLKGTADTAVAPVTGSLTQQITFATDESTRIDKQIDNWTNRLDTMRTTLQAKYTVMNATLARLSSQSTYLTNMLKSATADSSDS